MNDLIRRGALEMVILHETAWYDNRDEDVAYAAVQATPSVDDVEVVHARWTRKDNSQNCKRIGDFEEWYECSACEGDSEHGSAYCPDCGARMDVEAISKTETTTREKEAKQDG